MRAVLSRLVALLRSRNSMPIEGREATRWWPKSAALIDVERAVVASNAAEVERLAERGREREEGRP